MKIFPILLATLFWVLMITTIAVVVGFTLADPNWFWGKGGEYSAFVDPFSWGYTHSQLHHFCMQYHDWYSKCQHDGIVIHVRQGNHTYHWVVDPSHSSSSSSSSSRNLW